MSIKDFDNRFGITSTVQEEKIKFITRIEDLVFRLVQKDNPGTYETFFRHVCLREGIKYNEVQLNWNPINRANVPPLSHLTKRDFIQTLKIVSYILEFPGYKPNIEAAVSLIISDFLSHSKLDLGIKFVNNEFYPTGESLLDEDLTAYSLEALKKFPDQNKHLNNALKHFASNDLENTLQDCHLCLEGLAQKILNNNRNLDNNREDLLRHLEFSHEWKAILSTFLKYINEYGRHTKGNTKPIKEFEVESSLYQTCLLIRAMIRSLRS